MTSFPPQVIADAIGAIIQHNRRRPGLSQKTMALTVGISPRTLWRIENDPDYRPSWQMVVAILGALGFRILMGRKGL